MSKRLKLAGALVFALALAAVTAGSIARAGAPANASGPDSGCTFANGIKHVIQIQFDNTHFLRDNPNVPSDLEQMPHLFFFSSRRRHTIFDCGWSSDVCSSDLDLGSVGPALLEGGLIFQIG